jgi:hypothetical protein
MLPDMSDVLTEWLQPVKLKTVSTVDDDDFNSVASVVVATVQAVVQPADKTKLQIGSLDWSKEYVLIHKQGSGIEIGQFVEWDDKDFKIIGPNGNYKNYGFIELVGEETKRPLLVAT